MKKELARDPSHARCASVPGGPQAVLASHEAVALIVGLVIGGGIFAMPAMVTQMTGNAPWMFGAWMLGGLVSLIGALCYAELATAYSHTGGGYHFLRLAYGRSVAFLFGWACFSVITTGSIALLGDAVCSRCQFTSPPLIGEQQ